MFYTFSRKRTGEEIWGYLLVCYEFHDVIRSSISDGTWMCCWASIQLVRVSRFCVVSSTSLLTCVVDMSPDSIFPSADRLLVRRSSLQVSWYLIWNLNLAERGRTSLRKSPPPPPPPQIHSWWITAVQYCSIRLVVVLPLQDSWNAIVTTLHHCLPISSHCYYSSHGTILHCWLIYGLED